MRKNKAGRPIKKQFIKSQIDDLRNFDLSYTEIGKELNMSRQLVHYYHTRKLSTGA